MMKNIYPCFPLAHDVIEDTSLNTAEKFKTALMPILGPKEALETAGYVQELSNPPEGFPGNTPAEKAAAKKRW